MNQAAFRPGYIGDAVRPEWENHRQQKHQP
jgi:hypothetical protein